MTLFARIRRALVLVLLLPALLAPSGWTLRICACDPMSIFSVADACCPADEEVADEAGGCCSQEEQNGPFTEHRCAGCHEYDVGNGELRAIAFPSVNWVAQPAPAWFEPVVARFVAHSGREAALPPSPPGSARALPLRI